MNVIDQLFLVALQFDGQTRPIYSHTNYTIDWRKFDRGQHERSCILNLRQDGKLKIRIEFDGYETINSGIDFDGSAPEPSFFCALSKKDPIRECHYYKKHESGTLSLDTEEEIFQGSLLFDTEFALPVWQSVRRIEQYSNWSYIRIMGYGDCNFLLYGLDELIGI